MKIPWAIAVAAVGMLLAMTATADILDEGTVRSRLEQLPRWETDGRSLYARCRFRDFPANVEFVNRLVEPAQRLNHHPDLQLEFNRLRIDLTTHDAGGITEKDFTLAGEISQLIARSRDLEAKCLNPSSSLGSPNI